MDTCERKVVLTEEQSRVAHAIIKAVEKGDRPFWSLGGWAGVGKSTILKFLLPRLPFVRAVCCPTGKAASVLRSKGIPDAQTIHSLFYTPVQDDEGHVTFIKKSKGDLQREVEIIVIDEASMVNQQVHDDLISYDIPILYVGDHGQLPPVGIDPGFMQRPDFRLEQIHRQALDSPIIRYAHHIREHGFPPPEDSKPDIFYRSHKDPDIFSSPSQVITSFNKERVHINSMFREAWGRKGTLTPGDRVICLRNNVEHGLFNGTICEVISCSHAKYGPIRATLLREGDTAPLTDVPICPRFFGVEKPDLTKLGSPKFDGIPFDYAYAITCHKAQGSSWEGVTIFESPSPLWDRRRWLYTAFTRAEKHVTLIH